MRRKPTDGRTSSNRLLHAVVVLALFVSVVALPVCAMPLCDVNADAMPAMDHQDDCCSEPSQEQSPPPSSDCDHDCLLHDSDAPAELPGSTTVPQLVPIASVDATAVGVGLTLDHDATFLDESRQRRSETPIHILISQYLI